MGGGIDPAGGEGRQGPHTRVQQRTHTNKQTQTARRTAGPTMPLRRKAKTKTKPNTENTQAAQLDETQGCPAPTHNPRGV
jgi:hypothetical protein